MKKQLLFIISAIMFYCSGSLYGQTVITYSNHAPFIGYGATFMELYSDFEPISIDPGPAGPNQTWDFSSFTGDEETDNTFIDPADTPFADDVAGTSINLATFTEDEEGEGYGFMALSSSELLLSAFGFIEDGEPLLFAMFDPFMLINEYPFAYGDVTDTYGELETTMEGFTTLQKMWVTYSADAWGTITTPHDTYHNALRIQATTVDSIIMSVGGTIINEVGFQSIDYMWYAENHRSPVFEINADMENEFEVWSISYLVNETVGIKERTNDIYKIYPNPVSERLFIEIPASDGKIITRVSDLSGRLVLENIADQENGRLALDVSALKRGIYTLQIIRNNEAVVTRKIVVLNP
jgi:hypothetical protein